MTTETVKTGSLMNTRSLAKIAILGVIAFVLMLFEFPLPIAPSFYKMDFSEAAVLMAGFAMGPAAAVWTEGLKILLNLLFNGTITMGVGEFANFCIGCALCVPAAMIYQKNKSKSSAIRGLIVGTLFMTCAGVLLNYFVAIPAFVKIAHFPMDAIIGMGQAIFPVIDNSLKLVLLCVTPFNLIKGAAVSLVTLLLYKHISPLLHK